MLRSAFVLVAAILIVANSFASDRGPSTRAVTMVSSPRVNPMQRVLAYLERRDRATIHDVATLLTEVRGPSWARHEPSTIGNGAAGPVEIDEAALRQATTDSIRALQLIRATKPYSSFSTLW